MFNVALAAMLNFYDLEGYLLIEDYSSSQILDVWSQYPSQQLPSCTGFEASS